MRILEQCLYVYKSVTVDYAGLIATAPAGSRCYSFLPIVNILNEDSNIVIRLYIEAYLEYFRPYISYRGGNTQI